MDFHRAPALAKFPPACTARTAGRWTLPRRSPISHDAHHCAINTLAAKSDFLIQPGSITSFMSRWLPSLPSPAEWSKQSLSVVLDQKLSLPYSRNIFPRIMFRSDMTCRRICGCVDLRRFDDVRNIVSLRASGSFAACPRCLVAVRPSRCGRAGKRRCKRPCALKHRGAAARHCQVRGTGAPGGRCGRGSALFRQCRSGAPVGCR